MLKSLELENFKAFGERTKIELAPITLIFGENSAGKSTILQALNLLKQTREAREFGAPLLPRVEGGITDLGSFQELLFGHELTRQLKIGLSISTHDPAFPNSFFYRRLGEALPEVLGLTIAFRRPSHEEEIEVSGLQLSTPEFKRPIAEFTQHKLTQEERKRSIRGMIGTGGARRHSRSNRLTGLECNHVTPSREFWYPYYQEWKSRRSDIVNILGDSAARKNPNSFVDLEDTIDLDDAKNLWATSIHEAIHFYSREFSQAEFIKRMQGGLLGMVIGLDGFLPLGLRSLSGLTIEELRVINSIHHEGPGRPLKMFDLAATVGFAARRIESELESLFPMGPFRRPPERWYIFTGTNPDDVGYRGDLLPDLLFRRADLVEKANKWLEQLKIGYSLIVKSIGSQSADLFEVRLADTQISTKVEVGLTDVGFGISKILPFIVQCLATENRLVTIEQPEVHIHPRLQADLGDLIANSINKPYSNRFIIETHSEHLVLRFQKLVRDGKLTPDDIAVTYIKRGPNGARAARLHLDEDGDFVDDWPGGFFPERLRELM